MKIVLFYHSLASDWNHGNAHFLRGTVKELIKRGHKVEVYEPKDGWSLNNLQKDHGSEQIKEYQIYYPSLKSNFYKLEGLDFSAILHDADLVIVHEWNPPALISALGEWKNRLGYHLLFHDTHHRAASNPEALAAYDFSNYDGALVFGEVIKKLYKKNNWIKEAWVWHEAADAKFFAPHPKVEKKGDLVWIGNWGDGERAKELMDFLINPVKELGLKAKVYGVRYPRKALEALEDAGISYGGWLPNYKVPQEFAKYKMTVHVPRNHYVQMLPGIPTIRPFEAMACGIPLICSPWNDSENLFTKGDDYLSADNSEKMKYQMERILNDQELADKLAKNSRETILNSHTCWHRVNELEHIVMQIEEMKV